MSIKAEAWFKCIWNAWRSRNDPRRLLVGDEAGANTKTAQDPEEELESLRALAMSEARCEHVKVRRGAARESPQRRCGGQRHLPLVGYSVEGEGEDGL